VKFGKWGSAALTALNDKTWRTVLRASYGAKMPFHHFYCSLQNNSKRMTIELEQHDHVQYLAKLVWGEVHKFAHEFNCLMKRSCWTDVLSEDELNDPKIANIVVALLLVSAGEFHSRITLKTKRYPERLLLFVKKLPEEPCDDRKREAKSLLDADWRFLEINALKISILYRSELERMKSEGTCGE